MRRILLLLPSLGIIALGAYTYYQLEEIKLQEQADRIIASLRIPHLLVTFTFENYSNEQQSKFLQQFDLSFHKGGG